MKLFTARAGVAITSLLFLHGLPGVLACDPLTQTGCPADPALGTTVNVDFTAGASSQFTAADNIITYESDGIHLTVAEHGDAPILTSNWYIMFGRFEIVFKSATGVGMVSSAILQSDDLDEIDWELLGATPTEAQTNYFGHGITEPYNREVTVADATGQSDFNTYVIDWNQDRIIWSINGVALRTLYATDADVDSSGKSEYPQTPMQVKIGAWAGGDPDNAPGTIAWAGGDINYGAGPYTMIVQSLSVTDYSTGTEYEYSGTSGSWQDITAVGGTVLGAANGGSSTKSASSTATSTISSATRISTSSLASSSAQETSPATTTSSSSSVDTHTGWPWVKSSATPSSSATGAATTSTMAYSSSGSMSSGTPAMSSSASLSSSLAASSSTPNEGTSPTSTPSSMTSSSVATSTLVTSSTSQMATTSASATRAVYTGGATHMTAAKFGVAACIAAGLAFAV